MPSSDAAREQFHRRAHAYVGSPEHSHGSDLDAVEAFAEPTADMRALDVATGPGNTAARIAPSVASVVAVDVAPGMIDRAQRLFEERGLTNAVALVAEAERLPFADGTFDLVLSRIAPHHFADVAAFVREVERVLAPGGRFVLEDSSAPDDPALGEWIDRVESLRDPSHVHELSEREWRELLASVGLTVVASEVHRKDHEIAVWLDRADPTPEAREQTLEAFATAPPAAVEHYAIAFDDDGTPVSYTDDKLVLRAERR